MTVCGPAGSFGGVEARHCGDDVIRSLGFIDAQFRFNDFYCGRQWKGALAECLHVALAGLLQVLLCQSGIERD